MLEAEQQLKEFKQRNVGMMPGDGENYFSRLQSARKALEEANLQLSIAQNRRTSLRNQVDGEVPSFGVMGDSFGSGSTTNITSQYDARIDGMQSQLDQLLLQFTEKHPEVVGLRETISMLEAKRSEELAELEETMADQPAVPQGGTEGLVYKEMRIALGQAEAEVAGRKTQADALAKKVDELEQLVDTVPEVEAELQRLNRDYGLNKSQYDELLKRRESARMSQEVDQKADDVKLKVIEPPRVPLIPIGPNRVLFLAVVLGGGLAVGGGLAFLLAQINPRFNSSDELKDFARLPVIGVVSMISNRRQKTERRMELAVFSIVLLGLVSVFGGLVVLETIHFDLHSRVVELVEIAL